jgi:hypothetical protein
MKPDFSRRKLLLAGTGAAAAIAAVSREEWSGVSKVVAVGDVHGDCEALVKTLEMGGITDGQGRWTGGQAHCVQIGDIPARGPQSRKAMDLLMLLEEQAETAGGRMHCLIGNHDAMPMYNDMRGILPEEYTEFRTAESAKLRMDACEKELASLRAAGQQPPKPEEVEFVRKRWLDTHPEGAVELRRAYAPDGPYGRWIRSHNSIIRINDTLFVHGGVSPKMLGMTLSQINETIRRELADPVKLLPGLTTSLEGPLWYRGMAEAPEPALSAHVSASLRRFQVKRIVFGHTVTRSAIVPRFGSRVVNIDIGLSRFYGRPPACLVLAGTEAMVLHAGKAVPLPGPAAAQRLAYLEAVEAADPEPAIIRKLVQQAG